MRQRYCGGDAEVVLMYKSGYDRRSINVTLLRLCRACAERELARAAERRQTRAYQQR
jgi:hypothetical protein